MEFEWAAAVRSSSALRAEVFIFFDELHAHQGEQLVTLLLDIDKLHDSISFHKLLSAAIELDYPTHMLYLGIQMHMAPRIIKARDAYASALIADNGIIAGCTQSNIFARTLLF